MQGFARRHSQSWGRAPQGDRSSQICGRSPVSFSLERTKPQFTQSSSVAISSLQSIGAIRGICSLLVPGSHRALKFSCLIQTSSNAPLLLQTRSAINLAQYSLEYRQGYKLLHTLVASVLPAEVLRCYCRLAGWVSFNILFALISLGFTLVQIRHFPPPNRFPLFLPILLQRVY